MQRLQYVLLSCDGVRDEAGEWWEWEEEDADFEP